MAPLRITVSKGERVTEVYYMETDDELQRDIKAEGDLMVVGNGDPYPEDFYEVKMIEIPDEYGELVHFTSFLDKDRPSAHFYVKGHRRVDIKHVPPSPETEK